jgi:hypothetical protein
MTRIPVNPELLTWAREHAGLDALALAAWLSMCRCGKAR